MAAGSQAFVGAGSNLGDRRGFLAGAFEALAKRKGTLFIASSSIYETLPQGVTDQPLFLNAVFGLETNETPDELLSGLLEVEQQFGRTRHQRWGPRTIDLDLLMFEDQVRDTARLQLPHPRMFERAFVLVPLREVLRVPIFRGSKCESQLGEHRVGPADETTCRMVQPPFPPFARSNPGTKKDS